MIRAVWGIDTSNYRTSLAAVRLEDGGILMNERLLLPVAAGERGLRQSEAVFAHLKQVAGLERALRKPAVSGAIPVAVAVSDRPRDGADSYMPVFQAGVTMAVLLSAALNIPLFRTTHQRGHLAAAARGTGLAETESYLALHLSGGTTDLLAVTPEKIERIGGSMDLHAGQLVDRVGVALGLPFPSGPELECLAEKGESTGKLGASMAGEDLFCHFSGAESQAQRWILNGTAAPEDLAREVYDLLARSTARMLRAGRKRTGMKRALITGGVASSALYRRLLTERCAALREAPEPVFGDPALSGDNAVGTALIGRQKVLKTDGGEEKK